MRFWQIPPLRLILVLGLLHGLLYVFLVPPWQHYDEPTHFEYAWLIANRLELPKPGDYDQNMRRQVATSMLQHGFFRDLNFRPDLLSEDEPIWIGLPLLYHPPSYYLLVSLPLRFLPFGDVTLQLYAARLASLGLYLLSIVAAWGAVGELFPSEHPLRWMVPLTMAMLPGYVDLMTAVNSDVGATALFCLFLWGSLQMMQKGFSFTRFLWVGSTAVLSRWTKETVYLALPLLGFLLLFSLFRGRWRWVTWVMLAAVVPVVLASVFSWGDALFWYRSRSTLQANSTRVVSSEAPLGTHALQLEAVPNAAPAEIFQLLPMSEGIALRGKTVTLGGWIWATQPLTINAFTLYDGRQSFSQAVQIGTSPTFFAISATLAEDASRARVILAPASQKSQDTLTVFYDGLVMVEGARPLEAAPQFDDPAAQQGMWGGQAFDNLLRNASAESGGPRIRPWVEKISTELFYITSYPSLMLGSLLDWPGAGWYYQVTGQNLLRTFWAKFGWGHVPLILPFTGRPYFLLAMLTLAGLGGAGIALWRQRFALPWNVLLFLGIALVGIWGSAILRGVQSLTDSVFIPGARYTYPAIIPTMLVLNLGWLEIMRYVERCTHAPSNAKFLVHFLLFLGLDIAALLSLIHFYSIR